MSDEPQMTEEELGKLGIGPRADLASIPGIPSGRPEPAGVQVHLVDRDREMVVQLRDVDPDDAIPLISTVIEAWRMNDALSREFHRDAGKEETDGD